MILLNDGGYRTIPNEILEEGEIYTDLSPRDLFVGGDHTLPKFKIVNGEIEIDLPTVIEELEATRDLRFKALEERSWRDKELARADIELLKVQDGRGTGTVGDWRDYRNDLRDYPESEGFPFGTRPTIG